MLREHEMPRQRPSAAPVVYQLKVMLKRLRPPIWRRIQVTGDTNLFKLHRVLQVVMGWTDSHLYQFIVRGSYYGMPHPDFGFDVRDEKRVALAAIASSLKAKFTYEYDFGDSWEHEILVEKMLPPDQGVYYPICLTGKRACPPEDCGGVWGYAGFLEAIQDPDHPEHEDMLEWVGGSFDPEAFDLDTVNRALRRIR
jgi:hypothetical protein